MWIFPRSRFWFRWDAGSKIRTILNWLRIWLGLWEERYPLRVRSWIRVGCQHPDWLASRGKRSNPKSILRWASAAPRNMLRAWARAKSLLRSIPIPTRRSSMWRNMEQRLIYLIWSRRLLKNFEMQKKLETIKGTDYAVSRNFLEHSPLGRDWAVRFRAADYSRICLWCLPPRQTLADGAA